MFLWLGVILEQLSKEKRETVMYVKSDATDFPKKVLKESSDGSFQGCFSPTRATFKFIGLILMCLMGFGIFFCYDNPAALQDYLKTDLDMPTKKFVMLYSIYSWPNVVMGFIGGFLLDSVFGIRWGTIIYAVMVAIGQLIFAMGAYVNEFWLMLFGRFVFGIGAESLCTAQYNYAVLWFEGKELNMVLGLQMSFARIGSTVNFLVMENIYNYVSKALSYIGSARIGVVLFISTLTCATSIVGALFLYAMDIHAERDLIRRNINQKTEIMKLRDVKNFRCIFWLVGVIVIAYYIATQEFISLSKVFFISKYKFDPATANTVSSLAYSISIVASPLFGILVDKTGKNILWVIVSVIGTLIAHGLLAFTYLSPYVAMVILGFSISLFESSLWTLISLIVPLHQLGTAHGIALSLENLGLSVGPIISGIIVDKYGYIMLEMFFLVWLLISLATAAIIWVLNRKTAVVYSINA